jgi:23S rRNA (uracil1939-C5)-methyltransferase
MKVAIVESLDHEGHGVVRDGGKVVFVEGALPRERIAYTSFPNSPR